VKHRYSLKVSGKSPLKFEGLQQFLAAVHTLARERRLSRYVYLYLASRSDTAPGGRGG
jgi:hypothetical protein